MKKHDRDNIFESYKLVSEAGFGIPGSTTGMNAPVAPNMSSGFSGNKPTPTPQVTPSGSSSTNPIPSGAASQSANLATQISSLDAKMSTMTQTLDNLTAMVAKLAMPEKRVGATDSMANRAASIYNQGAVRR
jgi:hypothetical protein